MTQLNRLKEVINKLGYENFDQYEKYQQYMEGVLDWNEKVNLTNITDREEFIEKHFVDSVLIADREEFKNADTVIDVGTGGGFPGVPLAILFPEKEFVLLDSLNKRLKIIAELTEEIGIDNVTVVHGRAEEIARKPEYREAFDVCVSRAVANLTSLSELCIPFFKKGGYFIAYKGPGVYEELEAAEKAIGLLGCKVVSVDDAPMQYGQEHILLFAKKMSNTPKKYPRKPGEPVRNPIK